ncbi:peptide ABC transporter substrate-binding protein [Aeromicrobium sp. CF3.5]|uniref:peptide ABC transporter substrate-binding protein n=1 Tax=Aeromicrobium sp. CF3.5 TaxID=3373078 RepID=UPI003EE543CE
MQLTRRTRLAGIALLAASSLTLAACGGGGDGGGSGSDQVISVYGTNPQNPLIPTATNEVGGGDPLDNLFSGVVAYNSDGSVSNEVAESVEPNEDSTVWTVKLKPWKFTDGSDVTAESFVKAWNYGANPDNKQLNNYFFYPIEGTDEVGNTTDGADTVSGLEVVDESTFTITLKEPESDFNLRLGYSAYMPVPESAYDADGKITTEYGDAPIGNGPYMLTDAGWEKNKQISLEPNPDYEGVHKAQNAGLVFKFYNSVDSAYTDVQSGNLDVLDQVPPSALTTFESDSAVTAYNQPGSSFSSFTIPERLDHFGDDEEGNLRRAAISQAINREEITEKVFNGARTPASDFTSPVLDGWTEDVEGNDVLEFNEEEAKDLWAQADAIDEWDGSFELAYNNDGAGNKEFSEAVTNQISNVLGIEAAPKVYPTFDELRTVVTDRSIETPFRTGWQADYPSMLNYLGPIYGTGAGSNDGDYSNEEFDQLVSEAATAEGDERYDLIGQAQAILLEDLPAIPLWYQNATAVTTTDLEGFEFNWKAKPDYYALTK